MGNFFIKNNRNLRALFMIFIAAGFFAQNFYYKFAFFLLANLGFFILYYFLKAKITMWIFVGLIVMQFIALYFYYDAE